MHLYLNMLTEWQKVTEIYEDDRPLGEVECRIIDNNRDKLTKVMKLESVIIDELHANKCITLQHKEYIESGVIMSKKVDNLLDILRLRSVRDFKRLAMALHRDGQQQLAQLLQQGGGMCS